MPRTSAIFLLALLLTSCGGQPAGQGQGGPPQVGFVTVNEKPVTISTELAGRTSPYETSDVRPQVNGLIRARLFQEGDWVKEGQPLYRIDAAPYEAQVASSRAALARAKAAIESSDALARRYAELVKINAVSRQEYENAVTAAGQAHADVAAQQAALDAALVDLKRTTVTAPISGRIGRSAFTTGALVSASQANPLTTIQRLDPIYVDITQSSADQLRLRQQLLAGELSREGKVRVSLTLEDGTVYPVEGVVKFTDVTVDPSTGSQTIRAEFANPNGLLLPGMYVRATFAEGTREKAILVPQRAVSSRDEKGRAVIMVIGKGDKLEPRAVTLSRTVGDNWLATSGLKSGDRVAVEGTMNLQPGTPVKAVPWSPGKEGAGAEKPDSGTEKTGADGAHKGA